MSSTHIFANPSYHLEVACVVVLDYADVKVMFDDIFYVPMNVLDSVLLLEMPSIAGQCVHRVDES